MIVLDDRFHLSSALNLQIPNTINPCSDQSRMGHSNDFSQVLVHLCQCWQCVACLFQTKGQSYIVRELFVFYALGICSFWAPSIYDCNV